MTDPRALVAGTDISFGESNMYIRVGALEVAGAFSLLEDAVPAGFGPPLHRHLGIIEAFYVLEGTYTFEIGGRVSEVRPGGVALVAASEAHKFTVGPGGGRSLIIFSPGGTEGYFRELGEALRAGSVDQAFRDKMKAAYGMEVLEPLPE